MNDTAHGIAFTKNSIGIAHGGNQVDNGKKVNKEKNINEETL